MAYGMKIYSQSNNLEFDSTSFGGIPIENAKDLSTIYGSDNKQIINYTGYTGKNITIIPLVSGDVRYYPIQSGQTYGSFAAVNYPRIAYWSISPDFSPTLATHGFVKKPTTILTLIL